MWQVETTVTSSFKEIILYNTLIKKGPIEVYSLEVGHYLNFDVPSNDEERQEARVFFIVVKTNTMLS